MSEEQADVKEKIQAILDDKVNPAIAAHGGSVALKEYKNETAYVEFSGGRSSRESIP